MRPQICLERARGAPQRKALARPFQGRISILDSPSLSGLRAEWLSFLSHELEFARQPPSPSSLAAACPQWASATCLPATSVGSACLCGYKHTRCLASTTVMQMLCSTQNCCSRSRFNVSFGGFRARGGYGKLGMNVAVLLRPTSFTSRVSRALMPSITPYR